ncbi:MAG: putative Ig domain-containing protein, partial [Ignavibacteria bacterium]|nr:putative Ig domain-containing protein [Ignavibacteria bacterium]
MKPILHFSSAFLLFLVSTLAIAQNKNVTSTKENHAPVFIKEMPDTVIDFGKTFKFTYKAVDEDGDKISYSSVNALPPRATFNDSTGVFSWSPLSWQAGKYEIIINATDGKTTT